MDPSRLHRAARASDARRGGCARHGTGPTSLARDTDGAIFVEYVTLLVFVGIAAAASTVALGLPLLRLYRYAQTILLMPFP